jgi:hypothetical protein
MCIDDQKIGLVQIVVDLIPHSSLVLVLKQIQRSEPTKRFHETVSLRFHETVKVAVSLVS